MVTPASELPVWTIRPNWRNNVLERLIWNTQVLKADIGTEQAIAMRLSPRREFEMTFNPVGPARSYFDLWMHRNGQEEFMLPLWHDTARLTTEIVAGATVLPVDTTYREFVVGDLAILIGDTPFDYDVVTVLAVNPSNIVCDADEITRDWGKNSAVHPLRRCQLSEESKLAALTDRVGEGTVLFQLNQANDIPDIGAWEGITVDGLPVFTRKPNWRESIDLSFLRNREVLDNETGLKMIEDAAGRAFTVQTHSYMSKGRAEHWAFRQMLYRLNGMQGAVWLPTFNEDIVLARPALAVDTQLDIKKIGYELTGGANKAGRNRALIAGSSFVRITDTLAALDTTEERLELQAAIGAPYAAGTKASFIDTCRLSSDQVEISHYTDTDGVSECKLAFQAFANDRTAAEPIHYPLPVAANRDYSCGTVPIYWTLHTWVITEARDPWIPDAHSHGLAAYRSPVAYEGPNGRDIYYLEYMFNSIIDNNNPDGSPGSTLFERITIGNRTDWYWYFPVPRPMWHDLTMRWSSGTFSQNGSRSTAQAKLWIEWPGEDPYLAFDKSVRETFSNYFRMTIE